MYIRIIQRRRHHTLLELELEQVLVMERMSPLSFSPHKEVSHQYIIPNVVVSSRFTHCLDYFLSVHFCTFIFANVQSAPTKAVGDVTIEWTSDTSVLVSWTPLSYSEAKGLPLYIITYKPRDGSSVGIDNTTSSSIVISGLNPLVGYIFTVQVTTENGNNKGDPLSGKYIHECTH